MRSLTEIRIGGLARLSSCDWPGQLVATIFCQGCPWACRYCHNPHLIPANGDTQIDWQTVLTFLKGRCGLLDGVVFSGGEPTLQPHLESAIKQVKAMGFRIGLHTGGPYPGRLAQILPLVDWVGFDIKAPKKAYDRITGARHSGNKATRSLRLLLDSGVAYDLRTTVHPDLLSKEELLELAAEVSDAGGKDHRIQKFRPDGCADIDLVNSLNLVSGDSGQR
ncbi:anaerobic ribonucleoside-triphosphate reductase activating protein [Devosia indica]